MEGGGSKSIMRVKNVAYFLGGPDDMATTSNEKPSGKASMTDNIRWCQCFHPAHRPQKFLFRRDSHGLELFDLVLCTVLIPASPDRLHRAILTQIFLRECNFEKGALQGLRPAPLFRVSWLVVIVMAAISMARFLSEAFATRVRRGTD